jgi:serine protease Do
VGLLPAQQQLAQKDEATPAEVQSNRLGVSVTDLNAEQRQQLQVDKNGVLVQKVGKGIAQEIGIQPGDAILRLQNSVVRDAAEFNKMVNKLPVGKSIAVLVQRNSSPIFLAFKIDK